MNHQINVVFCFFLQKFTIENYVVKYKYCEHFMNSNEMYNKSSRVKPFKILQYI